MCGDAAARACGVGNWFGMLGAMKKLWCIIYNLFMAGLGGCKKEPAPQAVTPGASPTSEPVVRLEAPPEITSESEDYFHDLVFYIREHSRSADGSVSLRVAGLHKGAAVGFEVVVVSGWKGGGESSIVRHWGSVAYRSTGAESDAFIRALDDLYETRTGATKMIAERNFTAAALTGNPMNVEHEGVRLKLFRESEVDGEYAEFYTNFDLGLRRLELHEKDPAYRRAVVKAMEE